MAENLWALREQKKLSVAMLASRAGLPIGLIMQYESGQRSIDPRHLARLARDILDAYSEAYANYPNRDNVLGPTRVFFSTYLESVWLLQLCVAAVSYAYPWSGLLARLTGRAEGCVAAQAPKRLVVFEAFNSPG